MKRRRWTKRDDQSLEGYLERGISWPRIAQLLKRSPSAAMRRSHRLGLVSPMREHRTQERTADLLGIDPGTVKRRVDEGLLRCHQVGKGNNVVFHFDDICAFLENESAWHTFDPHKITDSALREWAIEIRHGVTFLTTDELAPKVGLVRSTIVQHIHAGHLRAVWVNSGHWLIRSDWVDEFLATLDRPRKFQSHRRFSAEEDDYLRQHRATTYLIDLARALGRDKSSVGRRCLFLGLTGPVVPLADRRYRQCEAWPVADDAAFLREWCYVQRPRHLAAALQVDEEKLRSWLMRNRLPMNAPLSQEWEDEETEEAS